MNCKCLRKFILYLCGRTQKNGTRFFVKLFDLVNIVTNILFRLFCQFQDVVGMLYILTYLSLQ